MWNSQEYNRRAEERVAADYPVWVRNGNSAFSRGILLDLSESGAAVCWEDGEQGGELHLVISFEPGHYLSFRARRAWRSRGCVGLTFCDTAAGNSNSLSVRLAVHAARALHRRIA